MNNKCFREVKKGDTFRPVGATSWLTATADAKALDGKDDGRTPYIVFASGSIGEVRMPALGHLTVECKS